MQTADRQFSGVKESKIDEMLPTDLAAAAVPQCSPTSAHRCRAAASRSGAAATSPSAASATRLGR